LQEPNIGYKFYRFITANCLCGGGHETPRHIALYCIQKRQRRQELRDNTGKTQAYPILIGTKEGARRFVQWMMFSGRLGQFSLAKHLLYSGE
jgi:hypothetical protein